ncbi:hypothetical protein EXE43_09565 [Halorubrum sp. SS5]|nr:hypothetical protein EXE43_09565 [Halorubrum sp. SS5]
MQDLSNISESATERTNTPGEVTPILEFSPGDGLYYEIMNRAARGSAPGIPIYAILRDSNNDPLPLDTTLRFQYEAPSDSQPSTVSEVRDNIQPFRNLSIQQQQDEEFVDAVKIELLGSVLRVRDIDSLYLSADSSEQIDWSNSQLYVEGSVVDEKPKN